MSVVVMVVMVAVVAVVVMQGDQVVSADQHLLSRPEMPEKND